MKILIEFEVELDGKITEDEAVDIFLRELTLQNNVITDENFPTGDEKHFSIIVNGWSLLDRQK
jgi:hypothetical protein